MMLELPAVNCSRSHREIQEFAPVPSTNDCDERGSSAKWIPSAACSTSPHRFSTPSQPSLRTVPFGVPSSAGLTKLVLSLTISSPTMPRELPWNYGRPRTRCTTWPRRWASLATTRPPRHCTRSSALTTANCSARSTRRRSMVQQQRRSEYSKPCSAETKKLTRTSDRHSRSRTDSAPPSLPRSPAIVTRVLLGPHDASTALALLDEAQEFARARGARRLLTLCDRTRSAVHE